MSKQWDRDTATGDYKMHNGSPVNTDSLTIPAYLRVKIKRKKWMYAPDDNYGSDVHTVKKRVNDVTDPLLERIIVQALTPIVEDGRARDATAQVVLANRGGVGVQVNVIDQQNQQQQLVFSKIGV